MLALAAPTAHEDRNIVYLCADIAFQGIVSGAALSYLSVFAVRLGASTLLVGLLSSLPALLIALTAIPVGRFVARQRWLVRTVVRSAAVYNLAFLLIAFVPLTGGLAAPAIVFIWAAAAIVGSVVNVSFVAVMGEAVPIHRRAKVISLRYALHSCVAVLTLQACGRVLTRLPFPTGYQYVFAASFVAAMLSAYTFSRIRLPEQRPAAAPPRIPIREQWRAARESVRSEAAFFGYLGTATVFRLGMSLPSALYSVFWVKHLLLSDAQIATIAALNYAFTIVGFYFWARLAQRKGRAVVMAASCLGLSTYPLLTGLAHSVTLVYVTSAIGGLFNSGMSLAFFDTLLATTPSDRRATFVALDSGTANGIAFVGPLAGSLFDGILGIRLALFIAFGVRFIGGGLFALRPVRARPEPRAPEALATPAGDAA